VKTELPDELLVYDPVRQRAHCLNRAAALVLTHCDGEGTYQGAIEALAAAGLEADWRVVELGLEELDRAHLLDERPTLPGSIQSRSRRRALKKLGLVAGAALALPLVQSIVAPSVAEAASCTQTGGMCTANGHCCSKRCRGGICL
jgi:hypothetical protein